MKNLKELSQIKWRNKWVRRSVVNAICIGLLSIPATFTVSKLSGIVTAKENFFELTDIFDLLEKYKGKYIIEPNDTPIVALHRFVFEDTQRKAVGSNHEARTMLDAVFTALSAHRNGLQSDAENRKTLNTLSRMLINQSAPNYLPFKYQSTTSDVSVAFSNYPFTYLNCAAKPIMLYDKVVHAYLPKVANQQVVYFVSDDVYQSKDFQNKNGFGENFDYRPMSSNTLLKFIQDNNIENFAIDERLLFDLKLGHNDWRHMPFYTTMKDNVIHTHVQNYDDSKDAVNGSQLFVEAISYDENTNSWRNLTNSKVNGWPVIDQAVINELNKIQAILENGNRVTNVANGEVIPESQSSINHFDAPKYPILSSFNWERHANGYSKISSINKLAPSSCLPDVQFYNQVNGLVQPSVLHIKGLYDSLSQPVAEVHIKDFPNLTYRNAEPRFPN